MINREAELANNDVGHVLAILRLMKRVDNDVTPNLHPVATRAAAGDRHRRLFPSIMWGGMWGYILTHKEKDLITIL